MRHSWRSDARPFATHLREWIPERTIDESASVLEVEDDDPDAEVDESED